MFHLPLGDSPVFNFLANRTDPNLRLFIFENQVRRRFKEKCVEGMTIVQQQDRESRDRRNQNMEPWTPMREILIGVLMRG
jgi:hypothetical protein